MQLNASGSGELLGGLKKATTGAVVGVLVGVTVGVLLSVIV